MPVTAATNESGFSSPSVQRVTLRRVLRFFHVQNLSNASLEEAIFLHLLFQSLATQARTLAAIYPSSLQWPMRVLLAAMNEPDKNCSLRSAKHKRPSDPQAPREDVLSPSSQLATIVPTSFSYMRSRLAHPKAVPAETSEFTKRM
jgi:hypothetical protein